MVHAYVSEDRTIFALLGGQPAVERLSELAHPLVGALLRAEQTARVASGQSLVSRAAARRADALANALDSTRADLERALRAKQELLAQSRENEARRSAVLRSSLDAIISVDHEGKIIEFNPSAERMFGYRDDEMLGGMLEQLIVESPWKDALRRLLGRPEPAQASGKELPLGELFETMGVRSDGREFSIELAVTRMEVEGGAMFTSFIRDIAQRKQIENERGRLLGIVGHDLRNPLNSIVMGTTLLLSRGDLPDGHVKTLRRIQKSSERMTRLIADLLDFERGREGGIPLHRTPVRLVDVVRQVVEEIEVIEPNRQIELRIETDGSGQWDADRLAQVVSNLVGNAIQHSPSGTAIQVALHREQTALVLEITNQNSGEPIPPGELKNLFEPFRRGPNSTGLGLGLYIVQQIAVAHGGEACVQSGIDGTIFRVRLPL